MMHLGLTVSPKHGGKEACPGTCLPWIEAQPKAVSRLDPLVPVYWSGDTDWQQYPGRGLGCGPHIIILFLPSEPLRKPVHVTYMLSKEFNTTGKQLGKAPNFSQSVPGCEIPCL